MRSKSYFSQQSFYSKLNYDQRASKDVLFAKLIAARANHMPQIECLDGRKKLESKFKTWLLMMNGFDNQLNFPIEIEA